MEANKIEIKTLAISLVTIVSIEWAMSVVISKGLYMPMIILGAARLLEIILIILIVLFLGKGISSIGLARSRIHFGLKKGLIWSAGFAVVASFAFVVLFAAGSNPLKLIQVQLPTTHSEIAFFS